MKSNSISTAIRQVQVLLILLVFASATALQAQEPPTIYIEVIKVKDLNHELMNLEEEMMRPFAQQRIKEGTMLAHYFFRVRYPYSETAAYDHVMVHVYSDFDHLHTTNEQDIKNAMAAFPGVDLRELATRWDEGLDVSDITVYAITDEAFPGPGGVNGEPSDFVRVNYMSVVPGKHSAYEEMESKYFKPVHQAAAKAGYMNDWVLAERVMPYGSDYEDDYITVDMYDKWSDLAAGGMGKLFSQVHPNENIGDVFNDIAALRDLKRSEVWERLMYVNSPPEEVSYNVIKEGSGYAPSPGQEVAFNVKTVNNEGEVIFNSRELGFPFYSTIDESPTEFFDKGMLQLKKGGVMEMTVPYDLLSDSDKEQANYQAVVVTIELVDFGAPARNGAELLHSTINEQGLPAAKALYQKLQNDNPDGYAFREGWMNNLGYILMEEGNNDAAIYIFQTNQKNFPKSWNCYDSLADGHRAAGNISEAKKYYKKALQLNPDFEAAKDKLSDL